MARVLGLLPSALLAARTGISERAWERQMRSLGLGARSSEMAELYRIATKIVGESGEEIFRDITQVPTAEHTLPWPTRNATAIRQQVTLVYRNRATGGLSTVPYAVTSQNGVTRESAMAQAIGAYSVNDDRYLQDLIGAVHTGSYQYVPFVTTD